MDLGGRRDAGTLLLLRVFVEGFVEACWIEEGMETISTR